jgi:hypothetical protein
MELLAMSLAESQRTNTATLASFFAPNRILQPLPAFQQQQTLKEAILPTSWPNWMHSIQNGTSLVSSAPYQTKKSVSPFVTCAISVRNMYVLQERFARSG